MNAYLYIPFLIFIAGAYFYYYKKSLNQLRHYKEKRRQFLKENPDLSSDKIKNLSADLPWKGMESQLLLNLFGEPRRKRELDQSLERTIWSYGDLFVYVNDNKVIEWKAK